MYSRIVHLGMLLFEKTDYFASCPYYRTISMSGQDMNRTVTIESTVESHTRTDNSILHLSFAIDLR